MLGYLQNLNHGFFSALLALLVILRGEQSHVLLGLWEMVDVGQLVLGSFQVFFKVCALLRTQCCVLKLAFY